MGGLAVCPWLWPKPCLVCWSCFCRPSCLHDVAERLSVRFLCCRLEGLAVCPWLYAEALHALFRPVECMLHDVACHHEFMWSLPHAEGARARGPYRALLAEVFVGPHAGFES